MAAQKCIEAGFENVAVVEGGTDAWVAAGLPVVRGQASCRSNARSASRAGLLVLAGLVLAYFVHPAFAILSALVGGGLVFAGVTDSCALGMCIARMPWNEGCARDCCSKTS